MATIDQTEIKAKVIEAETLRLRTKIDQERLDLNQKLAVLNTETTKKTNELVTKINNLDDKFKNKIEALEKKFENYTSSILPENALCNACGSKKWLDAEIMMQLKLVKNVEFKGSYYETPLLMAIRAKRTGLAKMLIEAGANIEAKDFNCNTALSLTAEFNLPELADILIKCGTNLNSKNSSNNTPLRRCFLTEPYSLEIFELLINAGADYTIKIEGGNTIMNMLKNRNVDIKYIKMIDNLENAKIAEAEKAKLEAKAEKAKLEAEAEKAKLEAEAEKIKLEAEAKLEAKNNKRLMKEAQQKQFIKEILFENSVQLVEMKKLFNDQQLAYAKLVQENSNIVKTHELQIDDLRKSFERKKQEMLADIHQKRLSEVAELKSQIAKLEKILADAKSKLECVDETGKNYPLLDSN